MFLSCTRCDPVVGESRVKRRADDIINEHRDTYNGLDFNTGVKRCTERTVCIDAWCFFIKTKTRYLIYFLMRAKTLNSIYDLLFGSSSWRGLTRNQSEKSLHSYLGYTMVTLITTNMRTRSNVKSVGEKSCTRSKNIYTIIS